MLAACAHRVEPLQRGEDDVNVALIQTGVPASVPAGQSSAVWLTNAAASTWRTFSASGLSGSVVESCAMAWCCSAGVMSPTVISPGVS